MSSPSSRRALGLFIAAFLYLWNCCALADPVRFVLIGDFGSPKLDRGTAKVAAMIKAWQPDIVLTLGDNAYSDHNDNQNAFAVDVGTHYASFIKSPAQDPTGTLTRFFPTLGNHDYAMAGGGVFQPRLKAYKEYFAVPTGPGGHHYFEVARDHIRFFALDSNRANHWDGAKLGSPQEKWFRKAVAEAKEPWKIAIFHHTPYVSGTEHAKETHMRAWNLESSGLTAVITGHEHVYERVMKGPDRKFPFITNGLGGAAIYPFSSQIVDGSEVRFGRKQPGEIPPGKYRNGALFGEATATTLTLEFWTAGGVRQDRWPADAPALTRTPQAVP